MDILNYDFNLKLKSTIVISMVVLISSSVGSVAFSQSSNSVDSSDPNLCLKIRGQIARATSQKELNSIIVPPQCMPSQNKGVPEPITSNPSETTTSKENQVTTSQNQPGCHKLDDGWWSPIAGPVVVNLCAVGPASISTSTSESTPAAESISGGQISKTPLPTTLPPVTEITDKQGNIVLSSGGKNVAVATIVKNETSQEQKDYNRGLLKGVSIPFFLGTLAAHKWLSEDIDRAAVSSLINEYSQGKSDAYKLGLLRGISMAREVMDTFVAPELIDVPN